MCYFPTHVVGKYPKASSQEFTQMTTDILKEFGERYGERLGDYISGCMKNGGAVTINLGIYQDGSVDTRAVDVLKEVKHRVRKEQP